MDDIELDYLIAKGQRGELDAYGQNCLAYELFVRVGKERNLRKSEAAMNGETEVKDGHDPEAIVPSTIGESIAALSAIDTKAIRRKYESALIVCIDALYEAIAIAPIDRLPQKAGDAIQNAQAILSADPAQNDGKAELSREIELLLQDESVCRLLRHGYKSPSNYVGDDDDRTALRRLYDISTQLVEKSAEVKRRQEEGKE